MLMPLGPALRHEAVGLDPITSVRQGEHRPRAAQVDALAQVEAAVAVEPVRQGGKGIPAHLGRFRQLHAVLVQVAVDAARLPQAQPPGEERPDLVGVPGAVGRPVLVPDLLQQIPAVVVGIAQAGVGLQPGPLVVGVVLPVQLPDHDKVALVPLHALQDVLGVALLGVAGLGLGVVPGGGDHVQQGLGPLAEAVHAQVVDHGGGVGMVFVHHKIGGRAGILVFGVLGQRPHEAAPFAVGHRVGAGHDEPLGDVRAGQGDLLGVPEHPHGLAPVYRGALHLRLRLKHRQLRAVGRIHGVGAHMIEGLARLFRGLEIPPGPLVVGFGEPPGPCLPVYPAIGAAQVKHLPRLELDGLARLHPPALNTVGEEADHPVGAGGVEDVGEIIRSLPAQIVKVPLAGQDLVLTALGPQLPLGYLLGVNAHRVVQPGFPTLPHVSPQIGRRPAPPPRPGPASGPAAPGRRGSAPASRRTEGCSAPVPGASR